MVYPGGKQGGEDHWRDSSACATMVGEIGKRRVGDWTNVARGGGGRGVENAVPVRASLVQLPMSVRLTWWERSGRGHGSRFASGGGGGHGEPPSRHFPFETRETGLWT